MPKSFARVVRPVLHRLDPELPTSVDDTLRRAWLIYDRAFEQAVSQARMTA